MSNVNWSQVSDDILTLNMEWSFNVPLSPHRTGSVEAMVRLIKSALYKAIKNELLDFVKLSVVFEEISAVVNSRPLGYVSSSSRSDSQEMMISPNMLCFGRDVDILPMPVKLEDIPTLSTVPLKKIHHAHRTKLTVFWKCYFDTYFNHLRLTPKWFKKLSFEITPGTFILVKEPNLKKFEYKTGKVVSTVKSNDGLVRTVEVQFAQNKKPVFRDLKICALLEHDFLRLSNDNHECNFAHHTCVLSSPKLDGLLSQKNALLCD